MWPLTDSELNGKLLFSHLSQLNLDIVGRYARQNVNNSFINYIMSCISTNIILDCKNLKIAKYIFMSLLVKNISFQLILDTVVTVGRFS